jgi:hypothetical protein
MIPYDLDPSLHTGEPEPQKLDDGFSPPRHWEPKQAVAPESKPVEPVDSAHWVKSAF